MVLEIIYLVEQKRLRRSCKNTQNNYTKKVFNDLDKHDDVVTHLELDILECEVKWAFKSITINKVTGSDGIPAELFKILKDVTVQMKVKVAQSCLTLCNPMDYTVHGMLQARILEWVAFPFSRASSQPRDQTQVSRIAGGFFTSWATREAHYCESAALNMSANLENSEVATGLEKVSFHSSPKEGQCQRILNCTIKHTVGTSVIAQLVKNRLAVQETPVGFLGWEGPLEKGYATHSSNLGLPLCFSW